MRPHLPQRVIRERHDVLEEDKSVTFRADASAPIGGSSGNLFFIGLPGSGRRTLARLAAGRLGLAYAEAESSDSLPRILEGSGQCVAVTGADLAEAHVREALRASGKVFYLMSLPHILASRLNDPARTQELAAEAQRLEPHFMAAAHFVMAVAATEAEMLEDVAEKARL